MTPYCFRNYLVFHQTTQYYTVVKSKAREDKTVELRTKRGTLHYNLRLKMAFFSRGVGGGSVLGSYLACEDFFFFGGWGWGGE